MIRTILVTKVERNTESGIERTEIYGRYDAVKLANDGFKIIGTEKRRYTMTDSDFAKYGRICNEGYKIPYATG